MRFHGSPRLYFEQLDLLNLHFNADPDPASKTNAHSCGSGSITLQTKSHNPRETVPLKRERGLTCRERLGVETGLVVVGGADSSLRLSRRKKKLESLTQVAYPDIGTVPSHR